ncbi:MAG: hypothetical protein IAG13_29575 [Deltaproteobacteria bacterium]|nr:hypothetical protein [Nannocystaceae bacterium]
MSTVGAGESTTDGDAQSTSATSQGESTTSGLATTSGDSGASTSAESTGEAPPISCGQRNPEFGCAPIDCSDPLFIFECGGHHIIDDDGCMRPWCDDDNPCAEGTVCYYAAQCEPEAACEFATCWTSSSSQDCVCMGFEDCPTVMGWCIPPDAVPC